MHPIARLQTRILLALALGGCTVRAVETESPTPDPATLPAPPTAPLAPTPAPPTPEPPAPLALEMEVQSAHVYGDLAVALHGEPGLRVLLFASDQTGPDVAASLEVDVVDPVAVASVVLDHTGSAKVQAPHGLDAGEDEILYVQAVAADASFKTPVVRARSTLFKSTCSAAPLEVAGERTVVCDRLAIPGQCPAVDALIDPQFLYFSAVEEETQDVLVTPVCFEANATGSCCYEVEVESVAAPPPIIWDTGEMNAGRPFRVQGELRQSAIDRDRLSDPLQEAITAGWVEMAREEHASIAAFARFTLELMQLGAPLELVLDASAAQADEVRHAQATLELASTFAGRPLALGTLPMGDALADRCLRTVTLDVVREGCLNETVSTVVAMEARDAATHPEARAVLDTIATDEARHAELSWRFVGWALQQDPSLREEVLAVLNGFTPAVVATPDVHSEALAAHGVLDAHRTQRAAVRSAQVIRQCTAALC